MSRAANAPRARNQLRIIGGQWRGRKLAFPPVDGLRPTTDRVRETLFNWLAPDIHGARCLDLFAGSGALGLEALSRGAAHCDFVDTSTEVVRQLRRHLDTLGAVDRADCHCSAALSFLTRQAGPWDIVFVDPPFGGQMIQPVCRCLAERVALGPAALVYVESGAGEARPEVPDSWQLHREKRAGGVCSRLFIVAAD